MTLLLSSSFVCPNYSALLQTQTKIPFWTLPYIAENSWGLSCLSLVAAFKSTLIQIWKSSYLFVFIYQQYPENFAFLILRIIELFAREVCKFVKKQDNFYFILSFLNVCKQFYHISHVHVSQNVTGVLMWNLRHIIFMWRRRVWQIFKSAVV